MCGRATTCLPGRERGVPMLRAVGESSRQPALEAASGATTATRCSKELRAWLERGRA